MAKISLLSVSSDGIIAFKVDKDIYHYSELGLVMSKILDNDKRPGMQLNLAKKYASKRRKNNEEWIDNFDKENHLQAHL